MRGKLLIAGLAVLALASCTRSAQEPSAVPSAKDAPARLQAEEPPAWPSPEAAGLDPAALRKLVERAKATSSDALVVVKDGRLVLDEDFGTFVGPIETMSATKSVVSLAVGLLLDEGRLKSVDQRVSDFYPEWKQGPKGQVTLRQLLDHTSGLENLPKISDDYAATDAVQLALTAEAGGGSRHGLELQQQGGEPDRGHREEGQRSAHGRVPARSPLHAPGNHLLPWRPGQGWQSPRHGGAPDPPEGPGQDRRDAGGRRRVAREAHHQHGLDRGLHPQAKSGVEPQLRTPLVAGRREGGGGTDHRRGGPGQAPEGGRRSGASSRRSATLKGLAPQSEDEAIKLVQKVFGPEGVNLWIGKSRPWDSSRRSAASVHRQGSRPRGTGASRRVHPRDPGEDPAPEPADGVRGPRVPGPVPLGVQPGEARGGPHASRHPEGRPDAPAQPGGVLRLRCPRRGPAGLSRPVRRTELLGWPRPPSHRGT